MSDDSKTTAVCGFCGKPIPEKRLQAVPAATLCVKCQGKFDRLVGPDDIGDALAAAGEITPSEIGL